MPNHKTYSQKPDYYRVKSKEYAAKKRIQDPDAVRAYKRALARANRESRRRSHLVQKYGITLEQYEEMLKKQDGTCAICLGPPNGRGSKTGTFHVDHDHVTGRVRGLLCSACNSVLGYARDRVEVLARAIQYLAR